MATLWLQMEGTMQPLCKDDETLYQKKGGIAFAKVVTPLKYKVIKKNRTLNFTVVLMKWGKR